jgi:hypothetical protein
VYTIASLQIIEIYILIFALHVLTIFLEHQIEQGKYTDAGDNNYFEAAVAVCKELFNNIGGEFSVDVRSCLIISEKSFL